MSPELQINLSSLRSNVDFFQKITEKTTEVSAVVKSDAYGLGIKKIASALLKCGIKTFFTATLFEALEVRKTSSQVEIFTLNGFDFFNAKLYKAFNITPVINDITEAKKFQEIFNSGYKTAIQLNTGFNRLGISQKVFFDKIDLIKSLPLNLIISHLACADDSANQENAIQKNLFIKLCRYFPNVRNSISASHGTLLGKEFHLDMVRPGIGLYGGIKNNGINNVIQVKVPVLQSFEIDKHMKVGYSFTFKAKKPMKVATLSIGYADGLPRILSNKGKLYLGNKPCPIIGRISMDLVTVDISDLPETPRHLYLFSSQYRVDDFAKDCQTISHEIFVNLGERITRVYNE